MNGLAQEVDIMGPALPPLVDRVITSMALNTKDHVSMKSLVRYSLGMDSELDLPGSAPVVDFLQRLDAEPVGGDEVAEKDRITKSVTAFLMSAPNKRRSKKL